MKWEMFAVIAAGLVVCGIGLSTAAGETEKTGAPLPKCPIMDEPINFTASLATDEGPIFFCCPRCAKKYQATPDKFAEKVAAQRKALARFAKVQVTCPISGKPANPKVYTEHNGKKVHFCCAGCQPKYEAEPAKYANALANAFSYQTKCPVMGEKINPQAFVELTGGQKIYFCCKGCDKKLLGDPNKFLPNLKKQGIELSADQVKVKG